tara:strand:- start:31438 stop:32943 length:1506 start_codon:yes stop_codon:yes gene_type:complete
MSLKNTIAISITMLLSACGGSENTTATNSYIVKGTIVDGNVKGALVYLDKNFNGEKDEGEVFYKTNDFTGDYELNLTNESCAKTAPIRAFVSTIAYDANNPTETIERSYTLSLPPINTQDSKENYNLTAFTTEVWEQTEIYFQISDLGELSCDTLNEENYKNKVYDWVKRTESNVAAEYSLSSNNVIYQDYESDQLTKEKGELLIEKRKDIESDKNEMKAEYGLSDYVKVNYSKGYQLPTMFNLEYNTEYKFKVRSWKGKEDVFVNRLDNDSLTYEGEIVKETKEDLDYYYKASSYFDHSDNLIYCNISERGNEIGVNKPYFFEKSYITNDDLAISLFGCKRKDMLDKMYYESIYVQDNDLYADGDFKVTYFYDGMQKPNALIQAETFFYQDIETLTAEEIFQDIKPQFTVEMEMYENLGQTMARRTYQNKETNETVIRESGNEQSYTRPELKYTYDIWTKYMPNGEKWCRNPDIDFEIKGEWQNPDNWVIASSQETGCSR